MGEENPNYRGTKVRITFDFSEKCKQKKWNELFKSLREKKGRERLRILHSMNLSFKNGKIFSQTNKFKGIY